MNALAWDYLAWVFLASCGVLQIAAAYNRLYGLLFLPNRPASALLGLLLAGAGFLWFFLPGPRLLPDTAGGLDGNHQAGLFVVGTLAGVAFTLLFSSVVNRGRVPGTLPEGLPGLEALRSATYLQLLRHTLEVVWKGWQRRTPPSFSG